MKGLFKSGCAALVILLLAGCVASNTEIMIRSHSDRTDVFSEVPEDAPPAKGLVDLTVKASVKTHIEGQYLYERPGTQHGAMEHPFLLNIDGQAVNWMTPGRLESTPHSRDGREDPEGGVGVRYDLVKKIRLKPGRHVVFFALPGEDEATEISIDLKEGHSHLLEFVPVYTRYRYHGPRFEKGVDRLKAFLNGGSLRPN